MDAITWLSNKILIYLWEYMILAEIDFIGFLKGYYHLNYKWKLEFSTFAIIHEMYVCFHAMVRYGSYIYWNQRKNKKLSKTFISRQKISFSITYLLLYDHTHLKVRLLTYTVIVNLMKHHGSKASIPLIASSIRIGEMFLT